MDKTTPEYIRRYLLHGLAATPLTLTALLAGVSAAELDAHPDPARFTLREAIAHLADWEGVWRERIERTVAEESPFLPSYDEGQWAIDHHYMQTDATEQLARFADGRQTLTALLGDLKAEEWARVGLRDEVGAVSVFEMVAMILGHDGYHVRQILDYRSLGRTATG